MDLNEAYRNVLRVPEDRVVVLPADGEIVVDSVHRGVLFVLAEWSIPAVFSFNALNMALTETPGLDDLLLLITDTDRESTHRFMKWAGGQPMTGAGETYWIQDGVIVGRLLYPFSPDDEEADRLIRMFQNRD